MKDDYLHQDLTARFVSLMSSKFCKSQLATVSPVNPTMLGEDCERDRYIAIFSPLGLYDKAESGVGQLEFTEMRSGKDVHQGLEVLIVALTINFFSRFVSKQRVSLHHLRQAVGLTAIIQ